MKKTTAYLESTRLKLERVLERATANDGKMSKSDGALAAIYETIIKEEEENLR